MASPSVKNGLAAARALENRCQGRFDSEFGRRLALTDASHQMALKAPDALMPRLRLQNSQTGPYKIFPAENSFCFVAGGSTIIHQDPASRAYSFRGQINDRHREEKHLRHYRPC